MQYLAELVRNRSELELMAPAPLNVVCFRFLRPGWSCQQADALNRQILIALHERGIAVPSPIVIGERFGMRCAITNHRTTLADIDVLIEAVLAIGAQFA